MMLTKFKTTYQALNKDNLNLLEDIYSPNAIFIDPFRQVSSIDNIRDYFASLYRNVKSIDIEFHDESATKNTAYISWNMEIIHNSLNAGKKYTITGVTYLRLDSDNKVIYHKDYFDAGAMLYQQLPILGKLINWIKGKV